MLHDSTLPPVYNIPYPAYADAIGWVLVAVVLFPVPICMAISLIQYRKNLRNAFKPGKIWRTAAFQTKKHHESIGNLYYHSKDKKQTDENPPERGDQNFGYDNSGFVDHLDEESETGKECSIREEGYLSENQFRINIERKEHEIKKLIDFYQTFENEVEKVLKTMPYMEPSTKVNALPWLGSEPSTTLNALQ